MSTRDKATQEALDTIISNMRARNPQADGDLVLLAYDFAAEAHKGQVRMTGEPYIIHPLATALTLSEMNMDEATVIAGLLHDVPEDTTYTVEDIRKNFGDEVAGLTSGIVKLGKIKYRGIERYVENLRKMFVAMAEDIRVVFIKFADRLHNLRTLGALPREKQLRIATESIEIYAAIANRLGMWQIKSELEDEAFKYLHPEDYATVKSYVDIDLEKKKEIIKKVPLFIKKKLEQEAVNAVRIESRHKRLWSLYQKWLEHEKDVSKIYDILALRIIVKTIPDCYAALGIVHQHYKPLKGRIKDYIANPKPNGYRSLHTTVFCERHVVEFQIRTEAIDREVEYGISSNTRWHYKEKGGNMGKVDRRLAWVKDLPKFAAIADHETYLRSLKIEALQNRIFVFTPKGDVIELPEGSTPIDFAYHLHTHIGNSCVGAKVNDVLVPVATALMSGDVVEIVLDKNRTLPSSDWLKFVKTTTARSKIKGILKRRNVLHRLSSLLGRS